MTAPWVPGVQRAGGWRFADIAVLSESEASTARLIVQAKLAVGASDERLESGIGEHLGAAPDPMTTGAPAMVARKCAACAKQEDERGGVDDEARSAQAVQPKLILGAPDDPLEREADQVAERVMRTPVRPAGLLAEPHAATLRRRCHACELTDETTIRRQPIEEEAKERQAETRNPAEPELPEEPAEEPAAPTAEPADGSSSTAPLLAAVHFDDEAFTVHRAASRTRSGAPKREAMRDVERLLRRDVGRPLDVATRTFMEPRFGVDFGAVRVHTGHDAAASARALDANAYTLGADIVFGAGRYQPATPDGRRLLAHELTHVLQQRHAPGTVSDAAGNRATPAVVQRDTIDYRALTWDDFQGKAQAGSQFDAATFSAFKQPDLAAVIPKDLNAQDTGNACVRVRKKSGNVMGSTLSVNISIDSSAITVAPFMSQEQSWHKGWLTDDAARGTKCDREVVAPCTASFTKAATKAKADCAKAVVPCKAAFKAGKSSFEYTIDGTTITASSAADCSGSLRSDCEAAMVAAHTFEATRGGQTITATSLADCGADFRQSCVDTLMPAGAAAVLAHEQGHFDITNVRAGQTQDALQSLAAGFPAEVTSCADVSTPRQLKAAQAALITRAKGALAQELRNMQARFAQGRRQLAATQTQYDDQTRHGAVAEQQATWLEKIAEGLPKESRGTGSRSYP